MERQEIRTKLSQLNHDAVPDEYGEAGEIHMQYASESDTS